MTKIFTPLFHEFIYHFSGPLYIYIYIYIYVCSKPNTFLVRAKQVSCTNLDARFDDLGHLLHHEIMEVRVESINWTVDAYSYVILADLVDERGNSGRHQMCRTSRHAFTNVAYIITIVVCRVAEAEFLQYLSAVSIRAFLVAVTNISILKIWSTKINKWMCTAS